MLMEATCCNLTSKTPLLFDVQCLQLGRTARSPAAPGQTRPQYFLLHSPHSPLLRSLAATSLPCPVSPAQVGAAAAAASCELRPQTSRKNLSELAIQGRPDQPQPVGAGAKS